MIHPGTVPSQIRYATIIRVLLAGFAAVILFFLAAGFIAMDNARELGRNAARTAESERLAIRMADFLREQKVLMGDAVSGNREQRSDLKNLLGTLIAADNALLKPSNTQISTALEPAMRPLREAASKFIRAAENVKDQPRLTSNQWRELIRLQEDVTAAAETLIEQQINASVAAWNLTTEQSASSVREFVFLLGGSLVLALICAFLTLYIAGRLIEGLESQSRELNRVTWHLLESQETTARRFSHELHDELGQTLTAIKANLAAVGPNDSHPPARITDCKLLVDDAIRNVRELSQLLHPIMLDDFGLDASLRWVAEAFTLRSGIEVEYESNFNERFSNVRETHIFRIVQEALTNVARHANATRVRIHMERRGHRIHLSLVDNGKGLPDKDRMVSGMGLTGMRARARSAGGELTVASRKGGGVAIELWAPLNGDQRPKEADVE